MKRVKQISMDIMVDGNVDGEYLAEYIMEQLNGNKKMILDGEILGSAFQEDMTEEYKLYYPELSKEGFRTVKITAGMTQEFEIISTNAPDHIIKAQLMYISACEEEGKEVAENPYNMIEEFGYTVNLIGCQDNFDIEDMETAIIDAEFDYYDI